MFLYYAHSVLLVSWINVSILLFIVAAFGVVAINGSRLSGFSFPEGIDDFKNISSVGATVELPQLEFAANESKT